MYRFISIFVFRSRFSPRLRFRPPLRLRQRFRLRPRFRPTPRLPSLKVNAFCPICKRKGALFGGGKRRMVYYLRDFYCNDTIKRVETKTRFKYPEREYLRVSDAKIRHPFGARIIRDN